ncbi:nucleotide-binding universal stress UspA family protein [Geodermatophilus bullaregiensis]|uniref:universal stress protein n=1 Tax=Geodermatophilus bullaregiensis TaxID=1564160 RepID=UPI00195EAF4B|nr:universal stress protein [Geodermatophilus bullaregiensis]MBM7804369.1 nucleotide-binding universal stress UspA family protein [Geodermatophilus bullaregiensis]
MTELIDAEADDDGVAEVADVAGGVLVGHDGSACAQEALQWAADLARRAGYPLHVLRAWKMTTAPRPSTWEPGYVPPLEDFETAVREQLEAHVASAGLDPSLSVTCHVTHGSPARGLIGSAARADLLVVGARGRGGFAGLVLGSVSDQCVRHAPCPVVVVRSGTASGVAAG